MCAYVLVSVCEGIYRCMYLRMFVARDAGILVSLYVFEVYPCIHPCPYAHLHVSMHVYACKYVCIYSSPYVRMHVSKL